jgi:hypothetical protein
MLRGAIFQYVSGGLLIACLILGGLWQMEKRGHRKANERIVELSAKLEAISTTQNNQRVATKDRIVIADRSNKEADDKARRVEKAPVPLECKTKPEILSADL